MKTSFGSAIVLKDPWEYKYLRGLLSSSFSTFKANLSSFAVELYVIIQGFYHFGKIKNEELLGYV